MVSKGADEQRQTGLAFGSFHSLKKKKKLRIFWIFFLNFFYSNSVFEFFSFAPTLLAQGERF